VGSLGPDGRLKFLSARLDSLAVATEADRAAVDIALDRYRHGISTYLDVLNPQNSLIQAEQQRIQGEYAVTNDLVTLYKALGGGWQATSPAIAKMSAEGPKGFGSRP
jgi:multidrug efflux system outer membrane protein